MNERKVAQDNAMFFVIAVGMSFGTEYFAHAVLDSFMDISQFPTDNVGYPGYIRVNSSPIKERGKEEWFKFGDKVQNGFLTKVSYEFSSATKFEGDYSEKVVIEKEGYLFSFHIKEYERSSDYNFVIINPEMLVDVPEDERLGRVVYLTISLLEN